MTKYVKIKIKGFCGIVMPSEKDNISEFNQYMKSDKMSCIIYADIKSLIKKIDGCANNPENPSTTKIGEHIPCGYPMSNIWDFDSIENKHTLCREKDCMKKFCTSLRKHTTNVINFEKKMLLLTKKELQLHQDATECYICRKRFLKTFINDKNYRKVRDYCYYTGKYRGVQHIVFVI